ncbi:MULTISPECIES: response regulator transcription factor [unclassified Paenibacillus]|uniref:response regulator transcription factor n=1 Tax=unclassified Paenibacillus TaxID=185978 RepID=UPI000710AC71|nr:MULTISPECIES: response regulator [unclassified Paenibacillus]KQX48526.1 AraC family transcriptional regulator [Paenibacillus sp. Root444D2]KRE49804.1 AraC family transcriptional regulator [Paenibacillus sp. Soil724D2]
MFQVLLVDDEALARNDVKSMLDWEKHGFTISGEAHNGSMALSMMEQQPPHIAILDVSMPLMNGVELSRMIKDRFPKVKMIMLSSFDDYDYVRTCLMNGAMDYLLKHRLNAGALLTLLDKAVQEWQSEEREHEARSAQTQMIERLSPVILRDYVANLARDVQEAGEALQSYARDNDLYTNSITYGTAAVQIVPFLLLTESFTDVQKNRFVQQATEVMQMAIGDIQKRTVGYVGEGRFIVLFSSEDRSEHTVTTQINQATSSLAHSLEKFLNLKCVYAIGPLCGNLRLVGSSYTKANEDINVMFDQGLNASILKDSLLMEEQKQLLLFLERFDGERINQIISTIFGALRSQPVYAMTVQIIVSEMLHLVERAWKRHFPHSSLEDNGLIPSRNELGRMGSVAELERWLLNYYARIVEAIKKEHAGGSYSRHISKAIQFIADNYASNISLDITASALNLNPSYLSRLFKEETAMTFTEYLNRVRIKTSCMLMESGTYALKQISSEVGFLSYTYFFKVFKSITGMTPQAYMDHLKPSKK